MDNGIDILHQRIADLEACVAALAGRVSELERSAPQNEHVKMEKKVRSWAENLPDFSAPRF